MTPADAADDAAHAGRSAPDSESSKLEQLTALLDAAADMICVRDRKGGFSYISPKATTLLGYTPDELDRLGPDIVDPDDWGRLVRATEARAEERGAEIRERVQLRHADGSWRTCDLLVTNRLDEPGVDGWVTSVRDVTDLAAVEASLRHMTAFLRAIVDHTTDAVLLVERSGLVTFCSAAMAGLTGHAPADVVGRSVFDLVYPDDMEAATAAFSTLLVHGEQPDLQIRASRLDGGWAWVEILGVNCLDDPDLGSLLLSVRNVTDRVEDRQRLETLLRTVSGAVLAVDTDRSVRWRSPGAHRLVGDHSRFDRVALAALLDEPDARTADALFDIVLEGGHGTRRTMQAQLGPATARRWVELTIDNAVGESQIGGVVVALRDVDRVVRTEQAGARLAEVLEASTDLVLLLDRDLKLLWANRSANAMLGDVAMGTPLRAITPDWVQQVMARHGLPALESAGMWRGEIALRSVSGDVPIEVTYLSHNDSSGRVEFISAIGRDMSERHALERRLHAQARHDPLTGLPNRLLLMERLEERLAAHGESTAVVFCDVDHFKFVNDSRGHDVGDRLLVTVTERLRSSLRPEDVVARFGGDEFVLILGGVADGDQALRSAERIIGQTRGPARADELEVFVTLSAGVAPGRAGVDPSTLIAEADAAMYRAKALGRDRVEVFDANLREATRQRLDLVHDLRRAITAGELEIWLQPVVAASTGRPSSVEALARWVHPERGVIAPGSFLGVVEDTGLVLALGEELIHRTMEAARNLHASWNELPVGVNLTARQLAEPSLVATFESAARAHRVDPHLLNVEITEAVALHDLDATRATLDALRNLGCRIVVDDFGTSHSSLTYLRRLPLDMVKIDREFVRDLTFDADWSRSLVAGIVSMCRSLGIEIAGEGVETRDQATILGLLGCDHLQGYLFGPALPLAAARAALDELANTGGRGPQRG